MEDKSIVHTITKKDTLFFFFTMAYSAFMMVFTIGGWFKLGFTISCIVFMILANIYLMPPKALRPFPILCGLMAIVLSLLFALYPDPLLHLIAFFVIAILHTVYFTALCGAGRYDSGGYRFIGDIFRVSLFDPIAGVRLPLTAYRSRRRGKTGPGAKILWGLLLALPVICVVIPLLIRSDAAFQGLVDHVLRVISVKNVLLAALGLLLSPFLISFLFHLKKGSGKKEAVREEEAGKVGDPLILNVFLSVLCGAYIIYLFSQLAYFIGAFSGMLPVGYDFTRAEYARRGFFEMTAIAVINLIVLFVAHVLIRHKSRGGKLYTTAVSLFICFFTLFIIVTALFKMLFYIESFGMTRLRLGTSVFMILLALVFIAAILRLLLPRFPYMKMAILSLGLVVILVGFADVDRCIAAYNIWAYETAEGEKPLDVQALAKLSDSVIPYLIDLMEGKDADVAKEAREALQYRFNWYFTKDAQGNFVKTKYANGGLRTYNWTLSKNQALLLEYKDVLYVENTRAPAAGILG